jgi:hypothetical protein
MKTVDIAAAELTFNVWKLGFYYRPYGDSKWIRLPKCFTWKKAKAMAAECQIRKYLED